MDKAADTLAPDSVAQGVDSILEGIEHRLLGFIRDGGHETTEIDEILEGLAQLAQELREQFVRIDEAEGRRDLSFEVVAKLEAMRKRSLWLYRKIKLEHSLFVKVRLERKLRDAIYRQIVESFQELSSLEEGERALREQTDESLALELLKDL